MFYLYFNLFLELQLKFKFIIIIIILIILIIFILGFLPKINKIKFIKFFYKLKFFFIFNIRYILFFLYLLFLIIYLMSRIEFFLMVLFGIKNPIFFKFIRVFELYFLYKLNEKYDFFFKEKIIFFHFLEVFFFIFFFLFFFYFLLIDFSFYMFILPNLYFTFILPIEQKNKFYDKVLHFLNNHNNPDFFFLREQLELFNYIILLNFAYFYLEDFSYLEKTELFFILGFNF